MTTAAIKPSLNRPVLLDSFSWSLAGTVVLLGAATLTVVPEAWTLVRDQLRDAFDGASSFTGAMTIYVMIALAAVALFCIAAIAAEEAGTEWLLRRWPATPGQIVPRHEIGGVVTFFAMMLLTPILGRWLVVPTSRDWPVLLDRHGALTRGGERLEWRNFREVVEEVRHTSRGTTSSYVLLFAGGGRLIVNPGALVNVDEVCGVLRQVGILR